MAGDVEEVKQKTDIVSLISDYIELKKAGRNYKALCPFHGERTPSFMVSPELQIYKCFGCGESGDALSFLQKYEGMDFPEALKFLADRAGVRLKTSSFPQTSVKQRLYKLNSFATKFYQYILLKHSAGKDVLNYLTKDRDIEKQTLKTFQLGYAPTSSSAITKFLLEKKKFTKDELEKSGIIYQRDGKIFDRFRGRVIFPFLDHRGNTVGFSGRILPKNGKKDLAKYVNTPETPVFQKSKVLYGLYLNKKNIKKENELILVEGQMDVISSWQEGIKRVAAIGGTALTEEQTALAKRYADKAIFALDADLAGDTAARRGVEVAEKAGLEVRVASLGKYKDPDDMIRKAPDKFKKALKNSVSVWDFIIGSVFSKEDISKGEGKARVSKEIIPVLASISDDIVQAHYLEKVAKKLGVPFDSVVSEVEKRQSPQKKVEEKKPKEQESKGRRELLEERLMSLSFSLDPEILLEGEVIEIIQTPLAKKILDEFNKYLKGKKKFNPSEFAEKLPEELVQGFANMILKDSFSENIPLSKQKKEIELIKKEIQLLDIKEKLSKLAAEIKKYEEEKKPKKLKKAEEQFRKLTNSLSELEEFDRSGIIL